jgi:hypothetical protein
LDGIGVAYESIRGRSFDELKRKLYALQGSIPFGINYVLNHRTIDNLNSAAQVAASTGAAELLLLPEEPIGLGQKIDSATLEKLSFNTEAHPVTPTAKLEKTKQLASVGWVERTQLGKDLSRLMWFVLHRILCHRSNLAWFDNLLELALLHVLAKI